eukprot:2136600-Amphidinium_carterae.1
MIGKTCWRFANKDSKNNWSSVLWTCTCLDSLTPPQVRVDYGPVKLSTPVLLIDGHGTFHGSYLQPDGDRDAFQLPSMLLQCIGYTQNTH